MQILFGLFIALFNLFVLGLRNKVNDKEFIGFMKLVQDFIFFISLLLLILLNILSELRFFLSFSSGDILLDNLLLLLISIVRDISLLVLLLLLLILLLILKLSSKLFNSLIIFSSFSWN